MNKKIKTIIFIIIILVLVGGVILYNNIKNNTTTLEKTSVRLKWISQAQFAGFYTAQSEKIYEKAGLDVQIDPAGPNISSIQSVVSGNDEFGIAGADQIISAIDNGVPIVAVAVIYRETPESLVSKKSLNIKEPKDLEGKTVGVIYGNDEILYYLFLKENNVNKDAINEVPAITGISQVMTDKVDAKMAYEMNDAVLLKLEGEEVNLLKFREYGVHFYADTIFTTKEMVEKNPEKVEKFVKASMKGWELASKEPEKAIDNLITTKDFMPSLAEVLKECDKQSKYYYKEVLERMYKEKYFATDEEYGKAIMWILDENPLIPEWLKQDIDKFIETNTIKRIEKGE